MFDPSKVQYLVGSSLSPDWQNQVISAISRMTLRYPGIMLPKTPEQIAVQLDIRGTVVAGLIDYRQFTFVGFVTLWNLGISNVLELGTLGVLEKYQGHKIGTELVQRSIQYNGQHLIIATAKTAKAITALINGGMAMWDIESLPIEVRQATCCCTNPGEGGIQCPLANGKCRLLTANWSKK